MSMPELSHSLLENCVQVAYAGVTMTVYLAYYAPDFGRWLKVQACMPADSFCLSKQVVLSPQKPSGDNGQNSREELRRRQLKGKL